MIFRKRNDLVFNIFIISHTIAIKDEKDEKANTNLQCNNFTRYSLEKIMKYPIFDSSLNDFSKRKTIKEMTFLK